MRIAYWYSAGDASAVNTMLGLRKYRGHAHEIRVLRCVIPEEHPDNDRVAADVGRWLDWPVENIKSEEFESCEAVWRKRRYMSGVRGAPCTAEMKKAPRWKIESEWFPDLQGFGYTIEETARVARFRAENPEINLVSHLIEEGLTKDDCHAIVARAGIQMSQRYRDGFPNANCRGCVKQESPGYWNLERKVNPEIFWARAKLSREIGCKLVKLTSGTRERIYLDELDPEVGIKEKIPNLECSLLCYAHEASVTPKERDQIAPVP